MHYIKFLCRNGFCTYITCIIYYINLVKKKKVSIGNSIWEIVVNFQLLSKKSSCFWTFTAPPATPPSRQTLKPGITHWKNYIIYSSSKNWKFSPSLDLQFDNQTRDYQKYSFSIKFNFSMNAFNNRFIDGQKCYLYIDFKWTYCFPKSTSHDYYRPQSIRIKHFQTYVVK